MATKSDDGGDALDRRLGWDRSVSYSFSPEFVASQRNVVTTEDETALQIKVAQELRYVSAWHYATCLLTAIDAIGQFGCQLLYAVGINKVMQVVFGGDFRTLLDDFWQALLMYDVSFEAYIAILISVLCVVSICASATRASSYWISKRVERIVQIKTAIAVLEQQSSLKMDELLALSKSTKDVEQYLAEVKYRRLWTIINIAFGLVFIFVISPILGGVLLGMFALVLVFVILFARFFLQYRKRLSDRDEHLLDEIMVDIVGMKEVILLNEKFDDELRGLRAIGDKGVKVITTTSKLISASSTVDAMVTLLTVPVLLAYTFYTVKNANEFFQIFVIILSCFQFNMAFQQFVLLEQRSEIFYRAAETLKPFIDTTGLNFVFGNAQDDANESEVGDATPEDGFASSSALYIPNEKAVLELQGVSASYVVSLDQSDWILRNIDMTLFPGDRAVILGETGSGKSTLLKVMLGFVKPIHGRVFTSGELLVYEHRRMIDWRKQISMVSQDSPMFRRTIRDNITYGLDEVSQDDLEEACRKSCLTGWLSSLTLGLDTLLDSREKQLSGGQRQRIQICRALLSKHEIVIMDEPTAALDPETTETIMNNLDEHFKGKTAICITHDLAMLPIFSRVFRLSQLNGLVEDT